MGSSITDTFLSERIEKLKTVIVAYDDAIQKLADGAQSYQLDTGQTRQLVQRAQLSQLTNTRQRLMNELAALDARCNGGSFNGIPGF